MRVIVLVLLVACVGAPDVEPLPTEQWRVERKELRLAPWETEVDVVFVLDTDATTQQHREALIANASAMVASVRGQPSLHIGVATTDGRWSAATDGDLGTWLEAALDAPRSEAPPRLFDVALEALAGHPELRRRDAYLYVVIISARDDASETTVEQMGAVMRGNGRRSVAVIAGPRDGACVHGGAAAAAPRLHALLDRVPQHGGHLSICDGIFGRALALIPGPSRFSGDPCWWTEIDEDNCVVEHSIVVGDRSVVPRCAPGELPTSPRFCWDHVDDLQNCVDGRALAFAAPRPGRVIAQCASR